MKHVCSKKIYKVHLSLLCVVGSASKENFAHRHTYTLKADDGKWFSKRIMCLRFSFSSHFFPFFFLLVGLKWNIEFSKMIRTLFFPRTKTMRPRLCLLCCVRYNCRSFFCFFGFSVFFSFCPVWFIPTDRREGRNVIFCVQGKIQFIVYGFSSSFDSVGLMVGFSSFWPIFLTFVLCRRRTGNYCSHAAPRIYRYRFGIMRCSMAPY